MTAPKVDRLDIYQHPSLNFFDEYQTLFAFLIKTFTRFYLSPTSKIGRRIKNALSDLEFLVANSEELKMVVRQ
ncbi:hypothetical protein CBP12_08065 [Oceanisphaera avium]|uniref:Uncharacterized protein n=1 Tax=Oceanisphaera avium TaxID=1903694 RepID=A0A1Y0CYZ6_9GAMM|nr:hypothetical protein CBP12_08065 [Oceanisphaera avium]